MGFKLYSYRITSHTHTVLSSCTMLQQSEQDKKCLKGVNLFCFRAEILPLLDFCRCPFTFFSFFFLLIAAELRADLGIKLYVS